MTRLSFNPCRAFLRVCIVSLSCFVLSSCRSKPKLIKTDPAFAKYIEAYTAGVISKASTVRIQLTGDASVTHTVNTEVKEELFDFKPAVKGKAYWIDARTIEFKPEEYLKKDQLYEIAFSLGKVTNVPADFKTFKFNIETLKPAFTVTENGLRAKPKEKMQLTGEITTADIESSGDVEKLLKASYNSDYKKINWQHNEQGRSHIFVIDELQRGPSAEPLSLAWNGGPIEYKHGGYKTLNVPAAGDFKVLEVRAVQDDQQYISVQFSDMISPAQMFEGLIIMNNQEDLTYAVNGSEVKVFTNGKSDGNYTVTVNAGIQNETGKKLNESYTATIQFENRFPSVKIHGHGAVLPNSGGKILLPFEAVNLKAVDISILKIYESNIAQFLQSNDLNGGQELRRVAKPLVQATIRLDDDKTLDLKKKNRFSLDLDKYIRTEPGAIYRVNIGFRPQYSLYACSDIKKAKRDEYYEEDYSDNADKDEDEEFWQRYDDYYPYGYNWEEKDDPCSETYYNKERFAVRNVLASNLGLTAKLYNKTLFTAVNDIISTDMMVDVDLQVLDFQQQLIGKGTTDKDGIAMIELKRKPYLLIAKKGNEKGYLKLDDAGSLPLSRFDVSGAEVQNGIKGFIFGERGVWRPGDSLFLSCIIEDKEKRIPSDHPIEMELINPKGQSYKRIVQTNASNGFNVFKTATGPSAPTGNWTCKVKLGNAVFEKRLKIETVMPNRLKIDLNFGGLQALGKNANINGTLNAKWLFGATAQNLKAKVEAQVYKRTTVFDKFPDYVFDDPTTSFNAQTKLIFDGNLDENGNAVITPDFAVETKAPGMLLANLMVKVFEPGGNFSIDNIALPYHPYSSYAGVKLPEGDKNWGWLQAGKDLRFNLADVNTNGVAVNGNTQFEIQLYKVQWRWWWDETGNDLTNFTQDSYNKLIYKKEVTLTDGRGVFDFRFKSTDWGRYLLLVKDTRSGHTTGKVFHVDDYSWQSRDGNNDPSTAAMLSFKADKQTYNAGENINLSIPSSEGGRMLISVESGSKVIKTYWVKTEKGQTKFSFEAEKEMSPNIYVNVSLFQPHAQTVNDLPIRMYGVIPLTIEDKSTILQPVIKMADVIRPEEQIKMTVAEAKGKNMNYVIAVVDEGLLDLTRFKTPDPHQTFYAKEALGVKSWDLYDYVIGAWGGELQRILTIGGDNENELAASTRKANRFKPVVHFMGPFTSNGDNKSHTFKLPAYMGSVRVMVIAADNGKYGSAEKSVKVKKPLMILATLPRVLGPGETVKIPVSVFAAGNNITSAQLNISSNPFIESSGQQTVNFSGNSEQLIYFNARVKSTTGIGSFTITAVSGKEKATYATEIDIRNPNSTITQVTEAIIRPGQSVSKQINRLGDNSSSKAVVEISSVPPLNLEKRLSYLIEYPHGCIEQTVSSAFTQLVLVDITSLDDRKKQLTEKNVRNAIASLQNFRQSDGGFGYWPGANASDEFGTAYAGHFLAEAQLRGYLVPSDMISGWKAYTRAKANAWNITTAPAYGSDLLQAYRLYLLASVKSAELGAMNRLKEYKFITPEAKWRLAAAYHTAGHNNVALQLITGLPFNFPQRTSSGITYGSSLRDEAMVLETLVIMKREADAEKQMRSVAAKLSQEQWYSTQTTAYSLIAVAKFTGTNKSDEKVKSDININGSTYATDNKTALVQKQVEWKQGRASISVSNTGKNLLYMRIINAGKPIAGDSTAIVNNPQLLKVTVNYLTTGGQPIDITNIKQGTDFVAKVTVTNPGNRGNYNAMALSQIFPSGWEILNTRLYNSEGAFTSSPSDYMDIRDDRVYHYFDLPASKTVTYYVQLNAAYTGRFFYPGVYCEAMYEHTISGGTNGKWVQVNE